MGERQPAQVFPLIDFIDEEMAARRWDASDLIRETVARTDVEVCAMEIVEAMRPSNGSDLGKDLHWTDEMCEAMERAFGVSGGFFKKINATYWTWREAQRDHEIRMMEVGDG